MFQATRFLQVQEVRIFPVRVGPFTALEKFPPPLSPLILKKKASKTGETRWENRAESLFGAFVRKTDERQGVFHFKAEAENADVSLPWAGHRFGLRGETTLSVSFALPFFRRGIACAMEDEWWAKPIFFRKAADLPERTRFLLWETTRNLVGCLFPLAEKDFVSFLRGSKKGWFLESSTFDEGRFRAEGVLAAGAFHRDPFQAVANAARHAAEILKTPTLLRTKKPYPKALEKIGWCTWDTFYRNLNERNILAQMRTFQKKKVPVRFVLVDDGWYAISKNQALDLREDPRKFPNGLRTLIRTLKKDFAVEAVGLWHALGGHWSGFHPKNRLPAELRRLLSAPKSALSLSPPLSFKEAFRFFQGIYRWMRAQGADFVKVDGQGHLLRWCRNVLPAATAGGRIHGALEKAARNVLRGWVLNCMSHGPEHSSFWTLSNVTRSSNDFRLFGKEADPARHAVQNLFNGLWLAPFTWCDWDMFWSHGENAEAHQVLRAISGGPVYVSDQVGKTRPEIVKALCVSDGTLLRCDTVAYPVRESLFENPFRKGFLKIQNQAGEATALVILETGVPPRKRKVSFSPFEAAQKKNAEYLVWDWHRRESLRISGQNQVKLSLLPREARLFWIVPMQKFFTPIGIVDKLVCPKTIAFSSLSEGKRALVHLRCGGLFAAYCEKAPKTLEVAGKWVAFTWVAGWLKAQVPDGKQIKLRVEW